MKFLIRMRCFVVFLFIMMSLLPSTEAKAGPKAVLACVVACNIVCHLKHRHHCFNHCNHICKYAVIGCFSEGTKLSVLEAGVGVEKNVELIQAGDFVRTLKSGKPIWTKVLRNTKTEGYFDFVQIEARNTTSHHPEQLLITPDHAMIFMNEDGQTTLDAASHVQVGDQIVSSQGNLLSVTAVNAAYLLNKYTLETAEGTVLASNLLVSTICAEEVADGERKFDSTMEEWRKIHIPFIQEN